MSQIQCLIPIYGQAAMPTSPLLMPLIKIREEHYLCISVTITYYNNFALLEY